MLLSLLVNISSTTAVSGAESMDAIWTALATVGRRARRTLTGDDDATVTEQPGELPCSGTVGVVGSPILAEHPRIVHHQRVVRPGFETGHAVAPARCEELVVVAASVAEHRPARPR